MFGLGRKKAQQAADARIVADLSGATVEGQVAIGEHIVQIHAEKGAVVNYLEPEKRPRPALRKLPLSRLPRDFPQLLGRDDELRTVQEALAAGEPVEISGEPGLGKTVLLRRISHLVTPPEDGLVHASCLGRELPDVLQFLFETFYESDPPLVATPAELGEYLGPRAAVLVLDDLEVDRDGVGELLDTASACRFLWAATARQLWGEGQSVALGGLDPDAGRLLIERELRRALGEEEAEIADTLCRGLGGRPLALLQAAALLRARGPGAWAEIAEAPARERALAEQLKGSLAPAETPVLAALQAASGRPLASDVVGAATGIEQADDLLAGLERRHLARQHSPSYSTLVNQEGLVGRGEHERLRHQLVEVLTGRRRDPDGRLSDDEIDLALALLDEAQAVRDMRQVGALTELLDAPLALGRRWQAWARVGESALAAGEATEQPAHIAWARHQLGSRALCLGSSKAARSHLSAAIALREQIGDEKGAALSRHNLSLGRPTLWPLADRPWLSLGLIALAAIAALLAVLLASRGAQETTPLTEATQPPPATTGPPPGMTAPAATETRPTKTQAPASPPQLRADPAMLTFGEVFLRGHGTRREVAITNPGPRPVTVTETAIEGTDPTDFAVTSNECENQSLAPDASCQIIVIFLPRTEGERQATLVVSGEQASPARVPLAGTGAIRKPRPPAETTTSPTPGPPGLPPPR